MAYIIKSQNMKPLTKVTHWVPRILCILAILLVSMFAIDAFGPGQTIWHQISDFIIHLVPSLVLITLLVIAWRYEKTGGIIMAVAGTIFCIWLFRANYRHNHFFWRSFSIMMAMAFPFALSGILFIISHYLKKKEQVEYEQSLQEKQGENQSV